MITIKQKLISIIVLTSCLVLILTGIAIIYFDYYKFKKSHENELKILSEVISANSVAAIDFNDPITAKEILLMLRAVPHVDRAALYASDGQVLAQYQREESSSDWIPPKASSLEPEFDDQYLSLYKPIVFGDRKIGHIFLRADLATEKSLWNRYIIILICVMLISLFIALFVGTKLQNTITQPVRNLVNAAKTVTKNNDYSIRVNEHGAAEIQELVNAFNTMLDRIAQREKERDSAEHELKEHRDHLEELIQERTAELEASNKELEAFSYSVSHDLRAPLRSIHGFCQMLLEDYNKVLDSNGQDYLQRVQTSALNMGNLIEDLLQLARITRSDFNKQKLNISELAEETIDKLKQQEPERRVNVKVQNDLYVNGDEHLISVALDNLLSNSWKYTGKTEHAIIEFGSEHSGNGPNIYYVKDNGTGFDMKYADKIFLAFQRLHSKEDYPGTGVGLATVQRVIDRHGGKIWAESDMGKGTTIYFTLE
ncbi:ATP-binding protein [Kaarinaea lacus]